MSREIIDELKQYAGSWHDRAGNAQPVHRAIVEIEKLRAELAKPAPVAVPDGWKDFPDHVPPPGTECLVEVKIGEHTIRAVDVWEMQKECPVAWSSQTVPTGYGWSEHDAEDVVRWLPLSTTLAAAPQPTTPAVDVEAVRAICQRMREHGGIGRSWADQLERAIGDET